MIGLTYILAGTLFLLFPLYHINNIKWLNIIFFSVIGIVSLIQFILNIKSKDYTGLYFLNEDFNWDSGDVLNSILYKYGGYASYEYRDDWHDYEYKKGMNENHIGQSGMSVEHPFDKYKK